MGGVAVLGHLLERLQPQLLADGVAFVGPSGCAAGEKASEMCGGTQPRNSGTPCWIDLRADQDDGSGGV